jgi:hypothetical protein
MHKFWRPVSLVLSFVLVTGRFLSAQISETPSPEAVSELHLRASEGADAEDAAGKPSNQVLTFEVTDGTGAPVSGASVLVRLPLGPPNGVFNDGSHVAALYTDMQGRVSVNGIVWSYAPGTVVLRVTASKGTAHAGMLVERRLVSSSPHSEPATTARAAVVPPPPPETDRIASVPSRPSVTVTHGPVSGASVGSGHSKKWVWVAIAGAVAAGAAVALAGGGVKNPSGPSGGAGASTTVGTPTISIGHP